MLKRHDLMFLATVFNAWITRHRIYLLSLFLNYAQVQLFTNFGLALASSPAAGPAIGALRQSAVRKEAPKSLYCSATPSKSFGGERLKHRFGRKRSRERTKEGREGRRGSARGAYFALMRGKCGGTMVLWQICWRGKRGEMNGTAN